MVLSVCAGLCIWGVVHLRQAAAMTQCTNNVKLLALGVRNYNDSNRMFPLAVVKFTVGPGKQERTVDLPIEQCASWLFEIHPYVEARMDPRFKIDINKPWDAEENRYVADNEYLIAQCRGNSAADKTKSSYIGILGLGHDAGWLPLNEKSRGVFGFRDHVRLSDIHDGDANTIAIAETACENGRWIAGGFPTARGLDPQGSPYLGQRGQFGSFHLNKTNVGFADGSVRPLKDTLSPSVFEALATIAGGEKIDALALD
jgi:prepilin-type processing-associated H-X9-DG protein